MSLIISRTQMAVWRHIPWILVFCMFVIPVIIWMGIMGLQDMRAGLPSSVLVTCLLRTHGLACIVAFLSVALSIPVALWARLSSQRSSNIIATLIFTPVCVGMLARNYAWIGMLSQKSLGSSLGWSLLGGGRLIHTQAAVYLVMSFVSPLGLFYAADRPWNRKSVAGRGCSYPWC